MDKKYIQSKLKEKLDEANYIVKADDIDKVGDKLEKKLDDDDVVKVVDEENEVDCPCNGKCKKGSKCKEPVEENEVDEADKDENNPWAICTASVGREDKEKYEACVKKVKKQYGVTEDINEAEYQGKTVELNKPMRGDVKKYKVYVKNDKGNVVKVNFGDKDMEIKRDDPERRKAFRARHGCDNPGPKWKAKYWSCKFWSTKSVSDLLGEEENPCWSGYEMVGMKMKDGKEVPNCVKIKESIRPRMTKNQLIETVLNKSKKVLTVREFVNESVKPVVNLDGKPIDMSSIEIDGIDRQDYPDFVDAYFSYAEFEDGVALTDDELDTFTEQYSDLVSQLIHDRQLFL